ncbi:hypothetical protein [Actinokineospora iranica]|uniref:Uncharacterized protein n=1 Tax=Actinokineospora iranica TaxID=1271860 RepID=A0A1G6Q9Y5_9PSEU|nr:hypothetical protein [Actinokineospora iranica]SDC88475.1 hypothetical protein SAMN05216174_105141 [Actinokineospora iranica]
MDERKLAELFNDVVRDAPPASFDAGDVAAASARLTRKRNGVLAGSALGFALLAGGVAAGLALTGPDGPEHGTAAQAPSTAGSAPERNKEAAPNEVPTDGPGVFSDRSGTDSPMVTPKQGGSSDGDAGPGAGGTPGGCGTADRELAAALAGELPAATSEGEVQSSPLSCPTGSVSAALPVSDGPRHGVLSIMLTPGGVPQMLQPPWADRAGAQGVVTVSASGRTIVLSIESAPGSAAPPLDGTALRAVADKLVPRF